MIMTERLKTARKACGLTQSQVAGILGIDRSAYTYYETGKSTPTLENIRRLAAMFNVDISWLLGMPPAEDALCEGDNAFEADAEISRSGMTDLSKDERQLVAFYRMLKNSSDGQKLFETLKKLREELQEYDEE